MNEPHLQVRGLSIRFPGFALRDIDLTLDRGGYHILLGATGSGKSTLLRCLLGLNRIDSGSVHVAGRDMTTLPPERRRMGYVPQNVALFPHLTVEENIRFGTRPDGRRVDRGEAARLADLLKIAPLRGRAVRGLSGGEQQKTALARALAIRPEIVLLDEPFSSVDARGRRTLWFDVRDAIRETGTTALHITHDLDEAFLLGEQITVLAGGRIEQSGSAEEVYRRPATERVAELLNYRNLYEGRAEPAENGSLVTAGHLRFRIDRRAEAGRPVKLCIRPQDIKLVNEGQPLKEELEGNVFGGRVTAMYDFPEFCLMYFKVDGSPLAFDFEVRFPVYQRERHHLAKGDRIRVAIWQPHIIVFES